MQAIENSRRTFLRTVSRGAILGGLALLGIALARRSVRADQTCTGQGYCRGCRRIEDCVLPQAQSAKRAGVRGQGAP